MADAATSKAEVGKAREILRDRPAVETFIRKLTVELLMLDTVQPADIKADRENFLSELGATSIDALELIVTLEEKLGIEFTDSQLNAELVKTLDHFVDAVCVKLGMKVDAAPAASVAVPVTTPAG